MTKLDDILNKFRPNKVIFLSDYDEAKQQIKDLILDIIGKDEPITSNLKPKIVDQRLTRNQVKDYQRRKVELL